MMSDQYYRKSLKELFKNGKRPTQSSFFKLIDSMEIRIEDGVSKDDDDGLMLSPGGSSKKLISFFKDIEDKNSLWYIALSPDEKGIGLSIGETAKGEALHLQAGGNIGVGMNAPKFLLDVNGFVGSKGRVGTYVQGEVAANKKWQTIIAHLNGCHAFEVIARVDGGRHRGRYALLHAIALTTYGKSKNQIRKTQARFGSWRNKIDIRWSGKLYDNNLQIRTKRNYGDDFKISFQVTHLWGDEEFGKEVTHAKKRK